MKSYLNPLTPLGFAVMMLQDRRTRATVARERGDLGASAIEWVLITAIAIIIVGGVAAIIKTKINDKANSLDLTTNP